MLKEIFDEKDYAIDQARWAVSEMAKLDQANAASAAKSASDFVRVPPRNPRITDLFDRLTVFART